MDWEQSVSWALSCKRSDVPRTIVWNYSFGDLKNAINLRIGEKVADSRQQYANMVDVLAALFGAKKDKSAIPKSGTEAVAMFNKAFGKL